MDKKDQKKVLAKIEHFLDAQSQFWYPQSVIVYQRKSMYSSFDDMLKREILYTGYSAKELLMSLAIEVSSKGKRLDILFSYKGGDTGIALPDQSILEVLKKRVVSDIIFYTREDELAENQPIFRARMQEIATEKAKKDRVGRVFINNCFKGNFQYSGRTYKVIGYIEGLELYWLSILEDEEIGIFRDEIELRDWAISILSEWLQDKQPVQFEWSSEKKSAGQNGSYSLKTFKEITEISVDASFEEEPHVFRWREKSFTTQCKSSFLLPKQDIEDIINKSGLKIPKDAELIGISPYGKNTPTPCLKVRYIHTILDKDFDRKIETPPIYQNPGKIIIEGDFCIFYIDPENQMVISEFRKWRSIKEK